MDKKLNWKLTHILTEHDRRESTKKHYNRFALPQYFMALKAAEEYIQHGYSVKKALERTFCGRLLNKLLKAVDEA